MMNATADSLRAAAGGARRDSRRCPLARSPATRPRGAVGADHVAARPHRRAGHRAHRRADSIAARTPCCQPVQFFVDGKLLSTVPTARRMRPNGWTRIRSSRREITVAVADSLGNTARDKVVLKPFEITDARGDPRAARHVGPGQERAASSALWVATISGCCEDGVPQALDLAGRRTCRPPSRCSWTAARACRAASISCARRPAGWPASCARAIGCSSCRSPRRWQPITGPDRRPRDRRRGDRPDHAERRHRDSRLPDRARAASGRPRRPAGGRADHRRLRRAQRRAVRGRARGDQERCRRRCTSSGSAASPGISLQGRAAAPNGSREETGGRAFLPSREEELVAVHDVLAVRRAEPLPAVVHAVEPGARRHVARDHGRRPTIRAHKVRARAGYFAPKPPPVRPSIEFTVTDSERRIPRRRRRRSRRHRKRRRADGRNVPGSGHAGLDHPGARRERQHEEVGRDRQSGGRCASWTRCARKTSSGCPVFADTSELVDDLGTGRESSHAAIAEYEANGGTALYDALGDSLERLKRVGAAGRSSS